MSLWSDTKHSGGLMLMCLQFKDHVIGNCRVSTELLNRRIDTAASNSEGLGSELDAENNIHKNLAIFLDSLRDVAGMVPKNKPQQRLPLPFKSFNH